MSAPFLYLIADTPSPEPSLQSQLGSVATSQSLQTTTTPAAPSIQPTSSSSSSPSLSLPQTSSSTLHPQTTSLLSSFLPLQTGVDPIATTPFMSSSPALLPGVSPAQAIILTVVAVISVLLLMMLLLATIVCCRYFKNINRTLRKDKPVKDLNIVDDEVSSVCISVSVPSSPTASVLNHLLPPTLPDIQTMSGNMVKVRKQNVIMLIWVVVYVCNMSSLCTSSLWT